MLISALTRAVTSILSEAPGAVAVGANLVAWLNSEVVAFCDTAVRNLQAATPAQSYQPLLFQYFYLSFLLMRSVRSALSQAQEEPQSTGLVVCSEAQQEKIHPWILRELSRN